MDAVGSERAALCGYSEGGLLCCLFAATYPARTAALVMIGSYARRAVDPREVHSMFRTSIDAGVGAGLAYLFDPQMGNDRRARPRDQALARLRRGAEDTQGSARTWATAHTMAHAAADAVRPTAGSSP